MFLKTCRGFKKNRKIINLYRFLKTFFCFFFKSENKNGFAEIVITKALF